VRGPLSTESEPATTLSAETKQPRFDMASKARILTGLILESCSTPPEFQTG